VAEKPEAKKPLKDAEKAVAKTKATDAKDSPRDPDVPQPPSFWKTLRSDPPFAIRAALGFGMVLLILLVWWWVTHGDNPVERTISPSKLPSPGEVLASRHGVVDLEDGIYATLRRVFFGVALASLVGITVGVIASANRAVGAAVQPLVLFLRSIPIGALLPFMLVLFATGEKQMVMFLFFAVVAFVTSDTMKAISVVPERYVETAQTLGASNFQIIRKVLVPLALPDIITSLRFQIGLALGYIMLAEAIGADKGLGHMLNLNERLGRMEQNYFLLFVIVLLALGIDILVRYIQRNLFTWRRDL
jgi:NitT/TauT family transport system permease protein